MGGDATVDNKEPIKEEKKEKKTWKYQDRQVRIHCRACNSNHRSIADMRWKHEILGVKYEERT